MLKKFLSGIVGTVFLFCLTTISVIYIAKSILNGPLLMELGQNIISNTVSQINGMGIDNYTDLLFAGSSSDYPDIDKYFDNERIQEELSTLFTDYIKYSAGLPNAEKPSSLALSTYIEQCAQEYELKTGRPIDLTVPNAFISSIDTSLSQQQGQKLDPTITKAINAFYSDNVYITPIIIGLLCIVLLFIINRDISAVLSNIGTSLIMNGIGTIGMGFGLKTALNKQNLMDEFTVKIVNIFNTYFNRVGILCLIIGACFILIAIIYKKIKKNKQPVENTKQFFTYNN